MPASYFSNFPYVGYSLNTSSTPGEHELATDIFRRTAPVADLVKNQKLFYDYQIADGETPEIIADSQYGSTNYHWVVTLLNTIIDPLLDWPKSYANLVLYLNDKYGSIATASSQIHHYTMTQTKVDSAGYTSSFTTIIDQEKYDSLTSLVPEVFTFASGGTVTVTTTRASVDCYTYEVELNDSKRSIKLLKPEFLPQIVAELEKLISTV